MIVLVGFMGAGKSTVGRLLAAHAGLPFVDVDEIVARRAEASIADIFATHGETWFRALERTVVADVLAGPEAVVALGGGAVEDPATQAALVRATVVFLDVGYDEALRRMGPDPARPMLRSGDPRALHRRRQGVYRALASVCVPTGGRSPEDVAADVLRSVPVAAPVPLRRVPVPVPGRSYTVVVGRAVAARLDEFLPPLPDAEVAVVVTHRELGHVALPVRAALERSGLRVAWTEIPEGEQSKSLATAAALYETLAKSGTHRGDLVVAVGGGVVCDVAGFAASTYHRGMAVVHVPTTLLAQVDAAIGGKTGVNLTHGKNLVGTFHQPGAVVCDVDALHTLPEPELVSGLAEVVKYGFVADPTLLDVLERRAVEIKRLDAALTVDLIARSAAVKASFVAADERDTAVRAHLNYGHTFAHALEQRAGFSGMRHGEAVALGMMAAAHLARELGRIDATVVERHRRVLSAVGLPTSISCDAGELERAWRHDKKYRRGVRFVLLSSVGAPEAGVSAPAGAVATALKRLAS